MLRRAALAALAAAALALAVAPAAHAAKGDCGQPTSTGTKPMVADCLYVLRSAVGIIPCEACVCDVNGSKTVTAADALQCLRKAVGLVVPLNCPACPGVTTTLVRTSTTSTSTTSTTTTIPVACRSNADCSKLPSGYRCNPNNGTCEKPCTRNSQCKDFFECNKTTQYCQPPALMY